MELEIDPSELAELEQEWAIADDNDLQEHPLLSFKVDDTVITNASVRLRGNASHWHDQKKMQFEVSFNTYDKQGRFEGLKHALFDAAEYNRSFLRDRLALAILRDVGLAALCANNAPRGPQRRLLRPLHQHREGRQRVPGAQLRGPAGQPLQARRRRLGLGQEDQRGGPERGRRRGS